MIYCEKLTKRFGHFTAVDHVSFSVGRSLTFGPLARWRVALGVLPPCVALKTTVAIPQ